MCIEGTVQPKDDERDVDEDHQPLEFVTTTAAETSAGVSAEDYDGDDDLFGPWETE